MKKVITILLALTIMFTGCTSADDDNTANLVGAQSGEGSTIAVKDDKNLTLYMRSASTLNPLLNEDESVDRILRLLYEPLLEIDENYKPVSNIADSFYYSEEGTVITVNLKNNLLWHNQTPITADDLVFSINTIQSAPENSMYKDSVSRIAGVTKVDNYTVSIRFTEAFSGNMYALCFPLISAAYYSGENVLTSTKNLKPLGNSVYAFDSFIRAKELVLTSIENSFSTKPLINKIVVNITTDVDTDIYSFSQRISDAVIADNSLLGTVNLEDGAKKYSYIDNTYEFLGFNFDNEILSDKNIRKAIAYAIPTENIIESIYLSHATNTETPLNPKSWLKTQREATYGYNLNTAREYLNTAGFVRNESTGIREKTVGEETQRLTFSILVNEENEERIRIATRIADELNGIGFTVSVERVDFDTFVSRLEKGEFEMFLGGWQLSIVPQFNFMFASSANNYINYNSEKMNQLLYNYYQATTDQAMVLAMESLETEIIEELPYISLVFLEAALFVDKRISGAVEPIQYNGFRNIENWYIQ